MGSCWLCGSCDFSVFKPSNLAGVTTSDDYKISDRNYGRTARLLRCLKCNFIYADPLPVEDMVSVYTGMVDDAYNEGFEGRVEAFEPILLTLKRLNSDAKTLLDIGASTGLFCLAAERVGLQAMGVEPSEWAVNIAHNKFKQNVILGTFPHADLSDRKFDIISLIDVIEHVADPLTMLKNVQAGLTLNGLVVIVTPNVDSLAARLMGHNWWHYRAAHICYFSPKTMINALKLSGLRVKLIKSYTWHFTIEYVAERVNKYLPISWILRKIRNSSCFNNVLNVKVPVNLRDSLIFYCEKDI